MATDGAHRSRGNHSHAASEKELKYCMTLACLTATRCRGPIKVGAVIVRGDRHFISSGHYEYVATRADAMGETERQMEKRASHAENSALLNIASDESLEGCTMYVTAFPCCSCLKLIIEAGITDVIYLTGPEENGDGKIGPKYVAAEKLMMVVHGNTNMCRSYREELMKITKNTPSAILRPTFDVITERVPDDDHYFMAMAYLAGKHSCDPNTKVGVCIVDDDGRIVSLGYNTMPVGGEGLPWKGVGEKENAPNYTETKYPYVIHAVPMAILNRNTRNLKGCKLYVTLHPDYDCAKSILISKISELIYLDIPEGSHPGARDGALRMLQGTNTTMHVEAPYQMQTVRAFVPKPDTPIKFTLLEEQVEILWRDLIVLISQANPTNGDH